MAEDARRLLDHEGIARADVMGYSMGARIAAFLMLRHPERVRSAIFGGLGINMVRGMAGTGPIAHALEAPSIEHVTNPTRARSAPSPSRRTAISRRWRRASGPRAIRSRRPIWRRSRFRCWWRSGPTM